MPIQSSGRATTALSRQRVDALVDRLWSHRVTLVVAPAGSGKTTVLRQFAERAEPVAWCSADALEIAPDGCVAQIARVVGEAIGVHLDGSSVDSLAAGVAAWHGDRVALIIDDLHVIASTHAESELGRLIDRQPNGLVIAASTRSHPEFDVSRLRLDGQLLEITADDLRFRTWEADRLFREHYDMILGPADVAMLITRTEGWAAGLQLYRLAARHQPLDARRRLIGEVSATRVGRDYLARNVLSGLPDDLQTFLLDTAAVPLLTGAICDRVTGRNDSAAVLEHLEHRQLFTIAVDQRGTYRYHEVLRAHLDACLQQRRGAAGAAAHHRRIGALLEEHGLVGDALHAYSRASDWASVGRLVVDRMAMDAFTSPIVGDAWIELVPSPIVENDPYLLLARARERVVNGRFGAAMRDYDRASTGAAIDAVVRTCVDERAVLAVFSGQDDDGAGSAGLVGMGWLGDLRRAAQTPSDEIDALSSKLAHPSDVVGDPDLRGELGRGLATLLVGEPHTAQTIMHAVLRDSRADSRVAAIADLGLVVVETLIAISHGVPPVEVERVDKAVSILERCGLGWAARVARASLALTSQADGLDAARAVRDDCERDIDMWGAALASLFIAIGRGQRDDDASPAFDSCATAFADLGAHAVQPFVDRVRSTFSTVESARRSAPRGPSMRVHCFDALELVIDHRRVDLSAVRPRALSVLRVLALHAGRAVHRETLMHSLWPDVEPDAARHSLHVAISSLRKVMPPTAITRNGDAYRLELAADAFFDIRILRTSLAAASSSMAKGHFSSAFDEARRGVDVYRDDLLLDEGPADWVVGPREALRADVVRASVIAGEAAMRLGIMNEAARAAERGLAVDRYADPLWRILIESLEQSSDVASADRVRRSWREMMDEIGVG